LASRPRTMARNHVARDTFDLTLVADHLALLPSLTGQPGSNAMPIRTESQGRGNPGVFSDRDEIARPASRILRLVLRRNLRERITTGR
jgi:hypothetical protein